MSVVNVVFAGSTRVNGPSCADSQCLPQSTIFRSDRASLRRGIERARLDCDPDVGTINAGGASDQMKDCRQAMRGAAWWTIISTELGIVWGSVTDFDLARQVMTPFRFLSGKYEWIETAKTCCPANAAG